MTIIITLSFAGNETGPFDLYSDATGFAIPFAQNVPKADLLAGYQVDAPDGTTVVRLYSLQFLCAGEYVDIYSCATPNCDFTGSIICDVTTTTTTSSSSTTTTSTTYFPNPFDVPCLWSTNGGNPGLVAVYDFDTNTSTNVLVPNDFSTTVGINRPICATEDKLWLSDGLNYNDDPSGDNNPLFDYSLIKEYDISTTSGVTLTYVREIRVDVGFAFGNAEGAIKTISVVVTPPVIIPIDPSYPPIPAYWPTSDFPYLLVGAQSPTKVEVVGWDISTTGDIRLSKQAVSNWIPSLSLNQIQISGTGATSLDLTGMFITTDNNVFIASRFNGPESYNQLQELNGLPPFNRDESSFWPCPSCASWTSISQSIGSLPIINLQEQGVPEFTTSWTDIKAMPSWGVDGVLQVLQPETNDVYTISQIPDYEATLTTNIIDDNVWLSSATGCANIGLLTPDDIIGCTPTALPVLVESHGANYIGPITFTYYGMSVIASSNIIGGLSATTTEPNFTSDCGIGFPASTQRMNGNTSGSTLENPAFSYTLEFPVPVNNIPLRVGVLDPGDDFRFTTNAASTTLSITSGCEATVQNGNDLITDLTAYGGLGSVEVLVTGSEDFTILTFVGTNRGNGGPWALGCPQVPLGCNLIYQGPVESITDCASSPGVCHPGETEYTPIFSWNAFTGATEQVILSAGSAFRINGVAVSENYIITSRGIEKELTRYTYDLSPTGAPTNVQWEGITYVWPPEFSSLKIGMDAISDNKFVFMYAFNRIMEVEIVEGSTVLSVTQKMIVQSNGNSDCLITYKEDGVSPNKILYHQFSGGDPNRKIYQYDWDTGILDGFIYNPIPSAGDLTMIGNYLYISSGQDGGFYRYNTLPSTPGLSSWEPVPSSEEPNPDNAGDSGSRPECRISEGLLYFDTQVTTTTTTTTSDVNTVFSRFDPITSV